MRYENVVSGLFVSRPNRFTAAVLLDGREEMVHVKNTGRCRELLVPGAEVWLSRAANPNRKTRYDLIAVRKSTGALFNLDSQAPNQAVKEWLERQNFSFIRPEYTYGSSRIDFYMERERARYLLEIKGCTLERDGIGYFPDAPTERGVRHLHELTRAAGEGFRCAVGFVIQTEGVTEIRPNWETHPAFGKALEEAEGAGVAVLMLPCQVAPDSLCICNSVVFPQI